MKKITVNLTKEEATNIISAYISSNLQGFKVTNLKYNVYEKRSIRNESMGLDLKGIDIEVIKNES